MNQTTKSFAFILIFFVVTFLFFNNLQTEKIRETQDNIQTTISGSARKSQKHIEELEERIKTLQRKLEENLVNQANQVNHGNQKPAQISSIKEIHEDDYDFSYYKDHILPFYIASPAPPRERIAWRFATTGEFEDWLNYTVATVVVDGKRRLKNHRKDWELNYIYWLVKELDLCKNNGYGLAFAVGKEVLPTMFINLGCRLMLTDLPTDKQDDDWLLTNQQSRGLEDIFVDGYGITKEEFIKKSRFEGLDMNNIEKKFLKREFTFVWSTCSLEHLGSIELGKAFVINAMKAVKPGGYAIHTVEFTLSSNHETVEEGGTVFWRKRDIEELRSKLINLGYEVPPLYWGIGNRQWDIAINFADSVRDYDHFRYGTAGHVITSFAFLAKVPLNFKD